MSVEGFPGTEARIQARNNIGDKLFPIDENESLIHR